MARDLASVRMLGRLGERCGYGWSPDGCPCARCYIASRFLEHLADGDERVARTRRDREEVLNLLQLRLRGQKP